VLILGYMASQRPTEAMKNVKDHRDPTGPPGKTDGAERSVRATHFRARRGSDEGQAEPASRGRHISYSCTLWNVRIDLDYLSVMIAREKCDEEKGDKKP